MKIIIGLGNPGRKYERTRHNAGFMAVDELARSLSLDLAKEKAHALIGAGRLGAEQVVLAKPRTYMNESGKAAASLLREFYGSPGDLIVIHDELDLPLGAVRVKIGGGHGGHNGLRSIIEALAGDFVRVRIGIGRPLPSEDAADYVLSPFLAEERKAAAEAAVRAAEAVRVILAEGAAKAMNLFNQK
jgi:peptidyl-tRNA hydrolase, PTH1 family